MINDPANLEYVMKNEHIFGKGDFVKSRSWDLFGMETVVASKPDLIIKSLLIALQDMELLMLMEICGRLSARRASTS